MFNVANEPAPHEETAGEYFRDVISYARTVCDLPLTFISWDMRRTGGGSFILFAIFDFFLKKPVRNS